MPIEYVTDDLFAVVVPGQAFAFEHTDWESVESFRRRYPEMCQRLVHSTDYPDEFEHHRVWLYKAEGQPWVFNLRIYTSIRRCSGDDEANVRAVMSKLRELADAESVTRIAIPRHSVCRRDPRPWAVVEAVFAEWSGQLLVFDKAKNDQRDSAPADEPANGPI